MSDSMNHYPPRIRPNLKGPHVRLWMDTGELSRCDGAISCEKCLFTAQFYGRHDWSVIRHRAYREGKPVPDVVPSVAGLSPTMCEDRRHGWRYRGQHRYTGFPWEQTVERIRRGINFRDAVREGRLYFSPNTNYLFSIAGLDLSRNQDGYAVIGHVDPTKFNFQPIGYEKPTVNVYQNRTERIDFEVKDVNPDVMERIFGTREESEEAFKRERENQFTDNISKEEWEMLAAKRSGFKDYRSIRDKNLDSRTRDEFRRDNRNKPEVF